MTDGDGVIRSALRARWRGELSASEGPHGVKDQARGCGAKYYV